MDTPNKAPLDPLRRVWIPVEKRTTAGTLVFKTSDNTLYARLESGAIRRAHPKVKGKAARRADKERRRK